MKVFKAKFYINYSAGYPANSVSGATLYISIVKVPNIRPFSYLVRYWVSGRISHLLSFAGHICYPALRQDFFDIRSRFEI